MTEPQNRIRALIEIEKVDRIHNDLSNIAYRLKERVRTALEKNDRDGIGLDIMAALVMTAFTYEAYINFIGFSTIAPWRERDATPAKEGLVFEKLGLSFEADQRPRKTTIALRQVRNILAHGKPIDDSDAWESVGTHDELDAEARAAFVPEWEEMVSPEFLFQAFDDVDVIWRAMLKAADISVLETLRGGSRTITFLGHAEQTDLKT